MPTREFISGSFFIRANTRRTPGLVLGMITPATKDYLDAVLKLFTDKGLPVVTARDILQTSSSCITPGLAGDFNGDRIVDDADIDELFSAIRAGSGDLQFDVDSSGTVTSADVTFLVESILGTHFGDIDLDEDVDTYDLTTSIINFTSAGGTGGTLVPGRHRWRRRHRHG